MTQAITGHLYSYSNRGMRSNNPRTANKKLFPACRALMARFEKEGFPIETKFTSAQDISDYFGAERIICLRCGKPYKSLAAHITRIHGWTADEYKEFYGLAWRTGLSCTETKAVRSANGKRLDEMGVGLAAMSKADRDQARAKAHRTKHRKITVANLDRAKRRVVELNGGREFTPDEFNEVLRLMASRDQTAKEVLKTASLPSMTMFYTRIRADRTFAARYEATVESLSFAAQIRCQMLGERFKAECLRLRTEGNTVAEVARMLGASNQTVINNTPAFEKPLSTHCIRGHLKENGRCRICNTEHKRNSKGSLPRSLSAKTLIPSNCDDCGSSIEIARLRGVNRIKLCEECRHTRTKDSYRRYKQRRNAA